MIVLDVSTSTIPTKGGIGFKTYDKQLHTAKLNIFEVIVRRLSGRIGL